MVRKTILLVLTGLLLLNICQGLAFAQEKGEATAQSQIQDEQQKKDRLDQAIKYQKAKNIFFFVDQGYSILALILFLFLGLSAFFRRQIERITKKRFWVVFFYALVFIILAFIAGLPSGYYGFHLEQKYQLSNQNFFQWFGEQLKGLLVMFIIGVIVIEGVYLALKKAPRTWWIYVSVVFVFFTVLLINLAPVLIMPLFNVYTPLPQGEIRDKLIALSEKAGVKVEGIYEMDMSKQTKKANAMFTGIGNTKRIVLGDNLVKEYTPDEIEVVIAHEMGHNILRHIWKIIALMSFVSAIGFLIIHLTMGKIINKYKARLKIEGPADIASLPLFMLIFVVFSLITLPVSPTYSRYLEHQTDKYALELTCKPDAFISAMNKLAYQNLSDPNPSPVIEFLLYDHPPASKRIKFAETYIK
ncbi:MAG: M48 family metallopeptidase [candidate division Zixibacteria bacterium]|nr:M48 family metallopeptidase [candidate division Zixibacteria bacterium]